MAGGRAVDAVERELLDQLGAGEDLLAAVEAPAQPRQVVHHRVGQIALARCTRRARPPRTRFESFFFEPGAATYGTWAKLGSGVPEGLEDQELRERVRQVLLGADDVGDLHLGVVDDAGEVVERGAVGPDDHEVADLVGLLLDVPLDQVVDDERPAERDLEPEGVGAPLGLEPGQVGVGERLAAEAVGALRDVSAAALSAARSGLGRVVAVGVARGHQRGRRPAV